MELSDWQALESKVVQQIEDILSKPDYQIGEHSYKWSAHLRTLESFLKYIQEQIAALEDYSIEEVTLWRDSL